MTDKIKITNCDNVNITIIEESKHRFDMTKQILIVDDSHIALIMISSMCSRIGYKSISFTDPLEAMQFMQKSADTLCGAIFDIFLDSPVNGYELANCAHSYIPGLPILFVTGLQGEEDIQKIETIGTYCHKPVSVSSLKSWLGI